MKEVKSPKKPLIYYYAIVLLVLMVFNSLILPLIAKRQIKEVDYGTFMTMTEKGEIGKVEIESNQILFTDKDGETIYKTGVMNDPDLWAQIMNETPLKKWATPEEMADWAYFLTVTNTFCTGQSILVDGGESINYHFVWKDE